jgi:hypothetical protein
MPDPQMVVETLTEAERRALLHVVLLAIPNQIAKADQPHPLVALLAKISGVDTVISVRRAYPSRVFT